MFYGHLPLQLIWQRRDSALCLGRQPESLERQLVPNRKPEFKASCELGLVTVPLYSLAFSSGEQKGLHEVGCSLFFRPRFFTNRSWSPKWFQALCGDMFFSYWYILQMFQLLIFVCDCNISEALQLWESFSVHKSWEREHVFNYRHWKIQIFTFPFLWP